MASKTRRVLKIVDGVREDHSVSQPYWIATAVFTVVRGADMGAEHGAERRDTCNFPCYVPAAGMRMHGPREMLP